MNPIAASVLGIFGSLMAVVIVILSLPYLSPYAGAASPGLVSTGTTFTSILPWIGVIVAGGFALLAMEGYSRRRK